MEQQKFKEKCSIHRNEKLQYIRINDSTQQLKSKPFFICASCANSDASYNPNDYFYIKDITSFENQTIFPKWPPINNKGILNKLIEIANKQQGNNNNNNSNNSNDSLIDKILQFYKNLKEQVLQQLDISQKKMIEIAENIESQQKTELLIKQYAEITRLDKLREELLKNNMKLQEKETICAELIKASSQDNTSQLLEELLMKYTSEFIYTPEPAEILTSSILSSIQSINLFKKLYHNYNISNFQLVKGNFSDGQIRLEITTNNKQQQQVKYINENRDWCNTVSNNILQPNKKYLYRFKFDNLQNNQVICIGLMSNQNIHTNDGYKDYLSCILTSDGEQITHCNDSYNKINKPIKGQDLILQQKTQELELRISISEKILHFLNYPDYSCQLGLDDDSISRLTDTEDLTIFIGMGYQNSTVTLTCAQTVDYFD